VKLIYNAEVVLTVNEVNQVLTQNSIVIRNRRIVDVGPADVIDRKYQGTRFEEIINCEGRLVMPGLIDAHIHLSEGLTRGLFPDNLSTRPWVFNWAKPAYSAMNEEDEYISTLLSGIEMLKTGTTCFLDTGVQNDIGTVVNAITKLGMRGITGRHAADVRPAKIPEHWTKEMVEKHFFKDARSALDALESCVRRYNNSNDGRIRVWVNIEGKEPCSAELHAGARALADELGVGTTYHIASSIEEAHVSQSKYGMWPVSRLKTIGALGPNLVLAHVSAIKDEELDYLADVGTHVVFCPGTSLKLAKGATRIGKYPEMLSKGINVALGCDGTSASGSLDMTRQIYLAAGLFKDARMDASLVSATEALRMATINGAKALLWDGDIGSIETGKKADLVIIDLNESSWVPYFDPVQTLVYSARPSSVESVIVDGEFVMRDRKIVGVNEEEIYRLAREHAIRVAETAGLEQGVTPIQSQAYDN
jgi:5-methylthioadenosine/S-adenosylhomocysteine deaminase